MVMPNPKLPLDKVSIIIVTFNAGKYLQDCLNSIKKQTYPNLEVVIADGASTDNTTDIIRNNADTVSKWVSEKDSGIYNAMNKAVTMTTGDWVYFLGADDTLLPAFSDMLPELQDKQTIYYGSVLKKQLKYLGYVSPYYQAKIGIGHQAMIYPKNVFKKYKFDEKYRISADHHFNMKCYADPNFKLKFVDYIIADYNHTGISGVQQDQLFLKDKSKLILKYFGPGIWLRYTLREIKRKLFPRTIHEP